MTNELYTGYLVQGRHRVKSYKVYQIEAVPEEDRVRVSQLMTPVNSSAWLRTQMPEVPTIFAKSQ